MLQQALSKIMALPSQLALNEAQKKLTNTYCVVDGKLLLIENITANFIEYFADGMYAPELLSSESIEEITPFLPDTGIYKYNDGYIYLKKLPKKQWKKSFSWDYYMIDNVNHTFNHFRFLNFIFKNKVQPSDFYIEGNYVYYLTRQIGNINSKHEIILNDVFFEQELKDQLKRNPEWSAKYKLLEASSTMEQQKNTMGFLEISL